MCWGWGGSVAEWTQLLRQTYRLSAAFCFTRTYTFSCILPPPPPQLDYLSDVEQCLAAAQKFALEEGLCDCTGIGVYVCVWGRGFYVHLGGGPLEHMCTPPSSALVLHGKSTHTSPPLPSPPSALMLLGKTPHLSPTSPPIPLPPPSALMLHGKTDPSADDQPVLCSVKLGETPDSELDGGPAGLRRFSMMV